MKGTVEHCLFQFEGLWEGQPSPNINGEERFFRGAHIEDVLYVEEDEVRMQLKFSIL